MLCDNFKQAKEYIARFEGVKLNHCSTEEREHLLRAAHILNGAKGWERLLHNGMVIDCNKYASGCGAFKFGFFDHLQCALQDPTEFEFYGMGCYAGPQGAADWLAFHAQRIGVKSWSGSFQLFSASDELLAHFTI